MKIAMIDPSLFTLPYDSALCGGLRAAGCDVTLYGRGLRRLEAIPRDIEFRAFFYRNAELLKARVPDMLFHIAKGLEHAVDMTRLAFALHAERPDVVHFQWLPLPAIDVHAVRRLRRSIGPVVLTVHDTTPFNASPTSAVQRIGSTTVWQDFDHLIVHGDASMTVLANSGIAEDRVSIIPHGILEVARGPTGAVRRDAAVTVLMFGRIKAYKGVDVMIEALGLLPAALRTRCRLLIAGEPMIPLEPLRRRAEALGVAGNIEWDLRYVSEADMGELFRQADVFAFPYRDIDTSGVLMSCLRYGRPIVASGIGAFRTMLQDGLHGRIVPPGDHHALAAALEALLGNPAMMLACGRNVAQLSAQIPSWDAIARRTMALYESVLHRHRTAKAG